MRPRIEDVMVFSSFRSDNPQHPQQGRAGVKGVIISHDAGFQQIKKLYVRKNRKLRPPRGALQGIEF
jgi:hypothetical protein